MSRARWKPPVVDQTFRHSLLTYNNVTQPAGPTVSKGVSNAGEGPEFLCLQRSTELLPERVGRRIRIRSGNRSFSVRVTEDRVGNRVGEFAPTRVRPTAPADRRTKTK